MIAGVKALPPVGLMLFSVGDGAAVLDDGDVVVVVTGVWLLLLPPHPAVAAPTTIRAAAAAIARRIMALEFMVNPCDCGGRRAVRSAPVGL